MRAFLGLLTMLALMIGAATLSGCLSGQGQQSLIGASMDWRNANRVPANLVGQTINKGARR